jgi:very-short-patch-repair endonuclease
VPKIRPTNPHAKELRRNATDVERKVWAVLRNRQLDGYKFKFQATVGPFVADFLCAQKRLIVEFDGGQHNPEVDRRRTQYLENAGYAVLRFWNHDAIENLDGVRQVISTRLAELPDFYDSPSPNPLPQAGEGFER